MSDFNIDTVPGLNLPEGMRVELSYDEDVIVVTLFQRTWEDKAIGTAKVMRKRFRSNTESSRWKTEEELAREVRGVAARLYSDFEKVEREKQFLVDLQKRINSKDGMLKIIEAPSEADEVPKAPSPLSAPSAEEKISTPTIGGGLSGKTAALRSETDAIMKEILEDLAYLASDEPEDVGVVTDKGVEWVEPPPGVIGQVWEHPDGRKKSWNGTRWA